MLQLSALMRGFCPEIALEEGERNSVKCIHHLAMKCYHQESFWGSQSNLISSLRKNDTDI